VSFYFFLNRRGEFGIDIDCPIRACNGAKLTTDAYFLTKFNARIGDTKSARWTYISARGIIALTALIGHLSTL
jgi:hypothetical protein